MGKAVFTWLRAPSQTGHQTCHAGHQPCTAGQGVPRTHEGRPSSGRSSDRQAQHHGRAVPMHLERLQRWQRWWERIEDQTRVRCLAPCQPLQDQADFHLSVCGNSDITSGLPVHVRRAESPRLQLATMISLALICIKTDAYEFIHHEQSLSWLLTMVLCKETQMNLLQQTLAVFLR